LTSPAALRAGRPLLVRRGISSATARPLGQSFARNVLASPSVRVLADLSKLLGRKFLPRGISLTFLTTYVVSPASGTNSEFGKSNPDSKQNAKDFAGDFR